MVGLVSVKGVFDIKIAAIKRQSVIDGGGNQFGHLHHVSRVSKNQQCCSQESMIRSRCHSWMTVK